MPTEPTDTISTPSPRRDLQTVCLRAVVLVAALAICTGAAAAEWYVLCDRPWGEVVVGQEVDAEKHTILAGPLPGPRTAVIWIDENCPSRRCDESGRCVVPQEPAGGGWVAGELTTVTLGSSATRGPSRGAGGPAAGPGPVKGPGGTDLTPLIETAKAAVAGCNYPAALAGAAHLANFDADHPWLMANRNTLQRLAGRQRSTEQAVWQASSALSANELKRAHQLAISAANTSVSCQTQAVSDLVRGIDTAIQQRRVEKDAKRRRAAAALLPGLIDLARVISGGQSSPTALSAGAGTVVQTTAATLTGIDPCAFRYEFRDPSSIVPACTCAGYVFDPRRFRCAPG